MRRGVICAPRAKHGIVPHKVIYFITLWIKCSRNSAKELNKYRPGIDFVIPNLYILINYTIIYVYWLMLKLSKCYIMLYSIFATKRKHNKLNVTANRKAPHFVIFQYYCCACFIMTVPVLHVKAHLTNSYTCIMHMGLECVCVCLCMFVSYVLDRPKENFLLRQIMILYLNTKRVI